MSTATELKSTIVRNPLVVAPETTVMEAIVQMSRMRRICTTAPVTEADQVHEEARSSFVLVTVDDRIVGIFTERDVVRLSAQKRSLEDLSLASVMASPVLTLRESDFTDLFSAVNVLQQNRIRHLPILDQNDRVLGVVTQTSLLQALNRAEASLRESEQRFVSLATAAPVGIFRTDTAGLCLYVNDRWSQIAGLKPAQAAGFGWIQGIYPQDRELVTVEWITSVYENRPFRLEYRFQNEQGDITWVLGQAVSERDETGEIIGYVGTITNISDRKATEQALKVQRDFNQLIVEIVSRFVDISPAELDAEIELTLQLIAQITHCDTSYLFQFDEESATLNMTHEWSQPNELRHIGFAQNIPQAVFPWSINCLKRRKIIYVPTLDTLPSEATIDRESWQEFQFTAVLSVPIIQKSIVTGFMGFASFRDPMYWDQETIRLLQVMAQTIANAQERGKDEQDLSESEERLRLALAAANQGMYDLDLQNGKAIVNAEYALMLGYDPATFVESNADWLDRLHPDDREQVEERFLSYLAGHLPEYKVEFRQRTVSGDWKWILSLGKIVCWDEAGRPVRMLGTHTDISDRKQAETVRLQAAQLRVELTLLEQILDVVLAGYWDWDLVHNEEYLSPGFKRMFGYADHEIANSPESWKCLIFPEDLPIVLDCLDRHVQSRGKVPYHNEVRYRHKDGSTVWVICSGQVIDWDNDWQPLRMIGCHIDITERKIAEIKLQQTTAQLQASNLELEAFAYSVSHDLRAPLRAIDGFSQALLEDYGDRFDDAGKTYFDRIRHNIQRMGLLIDDLLRLSRVSRSEMNYSNVNLSALVEEQIQELQGNEPDRQVTLVMEPQAQAAIVVADATLMRVVISNLIQNAWKFTSHHAAARIEFGVIDTTSSSLSPGELEKTELSKTYFVRDDGAGFDMTYAKMLFGVFQRLHNTHEFPGTGIGLATVQRAIHRHGGRVWAEGTVEEGATFYFNLGVSS
jgi:PAS domain S-box-containing protein